MIPHMHIGYTEIEIVAPYRPPFVEALKAAIHPRNRRWDPDEKRWFVDRDCELTVTALCRKFYGDVTITRATRRSWTPPYTTPTTTAIRTPHDVLYVKPDAPRPVIDAAYRALTKMFHPDVNPAPDALERIQELNVAYDRLDGAA